MRAMGGKDSRIRVMTLVDSLGLVGGGESLAREITERLDRERFQATLCVTRATDPGERAATDRTLEWMRARGAAAGTFSNWWGFADLGQHLGWFFAGSWTEQRAALSAKQN